MSFVVIEFKLFVFEGFEYCFSFLLDYFSLNLLHLSFELISHEDISFHPRMLHDFCDGEPVRRIEGEHRGQ